MGYYGLLWVTISYYGLLSVTISCCGQNSKSHFLIGQSEKSGIEIESEYQLTGHPVCMYITQSHCLASAKKPLLKGN